MTDTAAIASRRRSSWRLTMPVLTLLAVALLAVTTTLVGSPQATAQNDLTTCYSINDTTGTMVSFSGNTETLIGDTGLTASEALGANQDRNELWTYDNITQTLYSFTPGTATAVTEVAFATGDLDSLTWVNHTNGDPADDELWGTYRNGINDQPNVADELVQIDPATGLVLTGPITITDPGTGSDELDDVDGLVWDATSDVFYSVIGGDTTDNFLITIDRTDGSITQLALTPPITDIESLGAGTDGQIYATTGEDLSTPNNFYRIDKNSGVVTQIAALGNGVDFEGTACMTSMPPLVVDPATCYTIDEGSGNAGDTQHLIRVDIAADTSIGFTDLGEIPTVVNIENLAYRNGFSPTALYSYDPSTNAMLRLDEADGTTPTTVFTVALGDIDGMTWRNDNDADATNDELWAVIRNQGATQDELVQIDPVTGAFLSGPTTINTSGAGTFNDVDGLAWDPTTDTLYGVIGGNSNINTIVTVGTDGSVTELQSSGIVDIEGIGFDDNGQLYGTTGEDGALANRFLYIDKASGVATVVGDLTTTGYVDYESLDCAGIAPAAQPDLQIRLTVVAAGDPCPADFASAIEGDGPALPVAIGADVTYCLKVVNNGPGDATNVVVNHPLLAGPVTLNDLAAGEEDMTMFDDTVTATTPTNTTATVDGTDTQDNPVPQDVDPALIDPVDAPDLQIRLTVVAAGDPCPADFASAIEGDGPALPVAIGDDVTYCLKVVNNGPGDAVNVVVDHPLLAGPVTLNDLAAGEEDMTMFDDTVTATTPTDTSATVDGDDTLGNPIPQDADPALIDPVDAPDLQIRLTVVAAGDPCPADFASAIEGDGPALPVAIGDDVTYCLKVVNNGPGDAVNVVVDHPLLAGPVTLNDLAAGEEDMTMFDDTVTATTPTDTSATVDGDDTLGNPIPQDADPALIDPVDAPDLQIRLTVVAAGDPCPADFASAVEGDGAALPVAIGDDVTYCLKVVNNGPGDAVNVVVDHPLLAGPVTLNNLAAGEEDMTMFDDTVTATTPTNTTATVDGDDTLGNPIPQDADPAVIDPVEEPDLQIRLTVVPAGTACPADFASAIEGDGPALPVAIGADVTYCLKVINNGPGDATNVVVNHPLLAGPVTLNDLAAGEEDMTMFDDTVTATTPTNTTATVDGDDTLGNPIPQDADPAVIDPVDAPLLQIRLTVVAAGDPCPADFASAIEGDGPALPVAVGDDVTYCLKVINEGPGDATNVVVNHPLLAGPVTLNDLAAGEEDMTMFDDTVTATTPTNTTATVDGDDTLGNPIPQDADPAVIDPVEEPDLQIRLTVVAAGDPCPADFASAIEGDGLALPVAIGDDVTYCLKVVNNGPGDATNVVVNHPLLAGPVTLNDLAAGEEDMTMFDDTVTATTPTNTTATVDGDDTLGNPIPQDADPAVIDPVEEPDLQIRLTVVAAGDPCPADFASAIEGDGPALPVAIGDDVTYCLKVINNGPGGAQDVVVNHPLLPGPVTLNNLAAGEEDMTMFDDTVTASTPTSTTATVDGNNVLGDAIPQDTDPAIIAPATPLATIGNFVWEDLDRDGLQDSEPGIDGVQITVWNIDSNGDLDGIRAQLLTANGGLWTLDVPPGDYQVAVTLPPNGSFTIQDVPGDDTVDSDVTPSGPGNSFTGIYTVQAGDSNLTIDAGIVFPVQPATLGNFVWSDDNNNGVQDGGELGIEGITVVVRDAGGNQVGIDTTDANGEWSIDVPPGTYTVEFTNNTTGEFTTQNAPGDDALDSDVNAAGLSDPVTVGEGEMNLTVDAGIVFLGSIANLVFEDTDEDGVQDPTEPGVADVLVEVFEGTTLVGSDTTDADGFYLVGDLPAGDYTVRFTPPAGRELTAQDAGGDDALDSDPDPTTRVTDVISLDAGENNVDVDAGLLPVLGSIANLVFEDTDEDGVQDPTEPGVGDVLVEVFEGTTLVGSDTTDADGFYLVGDLPAGDYTVRFTPPAGRELTAQDAGGDDALDSDPDPTTRVTDVISLAAGENNVDVDAGLLPPPAPVGSLSNLVFEDTDEDGVQDPTEPGVADVLVEVFEGTTLVGSDTTAADGTWIVGNLPAGDYTVRFTPPPGRELTVQDAGGDDALDSDPDPTTRVTDVISLAAGENNVDVDAGLLPDENPVIGVAKELIAGPTLNNAGNYELTYSFLIENLGDVALSGVTLTDDFTVTFAPDGTLVGVPTPNGGTCSAEVAAGTHTLAVGASCVAVWDVEVSGLVAGSTYNNSATATGTSPKGTEVSDISDNGTNVDESGNSDPSEPGENDPTPAVVPLADQALLGDRVFIDSDGDGIQDAGEVGLGGVTVQILDTTGSLVATVVTNADGDWISPPLDAGDYVVAFVIPQGYTPSPQGAGTDPAVDSNVDVDGLTATITLAAGETNLTIDAGLIPPGSLGNKAFNDANANGVQDAGEAPIAGAEVTLFVANADGTKGDEVDSTTTDSDGLYSFDGLAPGDYIVVVKAPAGFVITPDNMGGDDAVDSDISPLTGESAVIRLGIGENNPTIDIGFVQGGILNLDAVDPYTCGANNFTGMVVGGVAPFNVTYTLRQTGTTRVLELGSFDLAQGGAYLTPAGYIDVLDGENADFLVTITATDAAGQSLTKADFYTAVVRTPCTVTPVVVQPGTPLADPGPFTNAPPSPGAPTAVTTSTPAPLAVTGANTGVLATLAIAMMGVGGVMLIGARRERDQD